MCSGYNYLARDDFVVRKLSPHCEVLAAARDTTPIRVVIRNLQTRGWTYRYRDIFPKCMQERTVTSSNGGINFTMLRDTPIL